MQMNSLHKRVQALTPAQRAELARRLSINGGGPDSNLPAASGKRLVAYVAHSPLTLLPTPVNCGAICRENCRIT
jgi:hypothetical protein